MCLDVTFGRLYTSMSISFQVHLCLLMTKLLLFLFKPQFVYLLYLCLCLLSSLCLLILHICQFLCHQYALTLFNKSLLILMILSLFMHLLFKIIHMYLLAPILLIFLHTHPFLHLVHKFNPDTHMFCMIPNLVSPLPIPSIPMIILKLSGLLIFLLNLAILIL